MTDIKTVYNNIARDFSRTRFKVWPSVGTFLDSFPNNSSILDIGCGNGKNMLYRNDLNLTGIDISTELLKICKDKDLNVVESSMTDIPLKSQSYDGIIAIASYHHLTNDDDRKKALDEMYRLLKDKGTALITVWAMEQGPGSRNVFTKADEMVKWTDKYTGVVYERYYHIYSKGDLVREINRLKPEFKIISEKYDTSNWYVEMLRI